MTTPGPWRVGSTYPIGCIIHDVRAAIAKATGQ